MARSIPCPNIYTNTAESMGRNSAKSVLFHQHARHCVDRAIHQAFVTLRKQARERSAFHKLLHHVRSCSPLMSFRPRIDGHCEQVRVLKNLARFHRQFLRRIEEWPGAHGSIEQVVADLATFLLGKFRVPLFLSRVWFEDDSSELDGQRQWFIGYSRGKRFRDLCLPIAMTRRMERLFLASPDHFSLIKAMRRAEVLALGGTPELADTVLQTRLGRSLEHGDFWRSVLHFFVAKLADLDLAQIGPMIDYFSAIRYETTEIHTPYGIHRLAPEQPNYSLKGRSLASVMRAMEKWHQNLGFQQRRLQCWPKSPWNSYTYVEPSTKSDHPPVRWTIVELLTSHELQIESKVMHHCVVTYAGKCQRGQASIWSLRRRVMDQHGSKSILTFEVDPHRQTIVQIRGYRNRRAEGKPLRLLAKWANHEGLTIQTGA